MGAGEGAAVKGWLSSESLSLSCTRCGEVSLKRYVRWCVPSSTLVHLPHRQHRLGARLVARPDFLQSKILQQTGHVVQADARLGA